MSAVDRYGFDLVAVSAEHRTPVRLAFPDECTTGDEVRRAMVAMVAEARAAHRLTGDGLPSPDLWLTDRTVIDWDSSSPHCS